MSGSGSFGLDSESKSSARGSFHLCTGHFGREQMKYVHNERQADAESVVIRVSGEPVDAAWAELERADLGSG